MKSPNRYGQRESRRTIASGEIARKTGQSIRTHNVGALPLLNRILDRMKMEAFLKDYLPKEDARTIIPAARVLLVMVRIILAPESRCTAWVNGLLVRHPHMLGLSPDQVSRLNDDRCGRALDKLFACDQPSLALVAHAVRVIDVDLDELHNDR